MIDFKDVMHARENATSQNENLVLLADSFRSDHVVLAICTAASAICLQLRSLECTLDYLGSNNG